MNSKQHRAMFLSASIGWIGVAALGAPVVMAANADTSENSNTPRLVEQSTRIKLTAVSEGDRSLGLQPGTEGKSNELGVDVKPEWLWQLSPKWKANLRLQAFAATGKVDVSDEIGGNTTTDGFFALREAWLDYNGLSSYPGESIRFGRERLKEQTGLWWDEDITLARWIFDTTLLKSTVGVAQKFAEMRTDTNALNNDEQDIARIFGQTRWQWRRGHYLGLLVTHAEGYGDHASDYAARGEPTDGADASLTWVAVTADRAYFDWHSHDAWQYYASVAAVAGSDSGSQPDASAASGYREQDRNVSGWAADLGLRAQIIDSPRWVVGAHGAVASGGSNGNDSDAFRQTGLQSNRSRFTGTRSQVQRFGEAVQPEWSNLKVLTLYTALSDREDWDANLLYHRYWLQDQAGTIRSDLIAPGYAGTSDDLGESVDLVLGYYGDKSSNRWLPVNLTLRGGIFFPGDAYGGAADESRHRVIAEVSKRF